MNNAQSNVHEGSSVYVKVLSENSNGNYTVYFAGNRVNVKSTLPLKTGEDFKAFIKISSDKKILLIPETSLQSKESSKIKDFLLSQNLPLDSVTEKLLTLMQSLSVKINTKIISKAFFISKKFPEKEKKASELALLLEEKGIEASEELIKKLLMELDTSFSENSDSKKNQKKNNLSDQDSDDKKDLSKSITSLYKNTLPSKESLLAFFNHYPLDSALQWLILPYEFQAEEKEYHGNIRIQYNRELKQTEKICIDACLNQNNSDKINKKSMTNYFFVLYFNTSKVREVRFCTLPPLLTSRIPFEERRLGELLRSGMNDNSVAAIYSTSAFTEGFFLNDEIPLFFDDSV